jgi:hypothetical protein
VQLWPPSRTLRSSGAGRNNQIESKSLYDGQVELQFDSGRHQYNVIINGRKYKVPSVTGVCALLAKPALIPWAVNSAIAVCQESIAPGVEHSQLFLEEVFRAAKSAHRGIKSDAASKGTNIHKDIERGLLDSDGTEALSGSAIAVKKFLDDEGVRHLELERRIYSRVHRFSGTLDLLGQDKDGRLVLLDYKTSKSIYPEFRLQTAAYCKALEEELSVTIDRRIIVQISADGELTPHYYERPTLRGDWSAFLGLLAVYKRMQIISKKH